MPKVLLVEDNEVNRDILSRRLQRRGYQVISALHGIEGVSKTLSEKPDLVLMNMNLPIMDGWKATRQLKANPQTQDIPVIALLAMARDREKALSAGCDEYETHPIDLPRLLGKMEKLLEKSVFSLAEFPTLPQDIGIQRTLLSHLRHELCTPINAIIGYSEMLLDELKSQPNCEQCHDLHKIHSCGNQLLTLVTTILNPAQLEDSQLEKNLDSFISSLRLELITPLSTVIGYCEILLEEATDAQISDLERIHTAAHRLLSMVNNIINLVSQQLQAIEANVDTPELMSSPTTRLIESAATTIHSLSETTVLEHQPQGETILVVDDVERLTTAAAEVEAKTFNPDTLADLAQRTDKLGQLARVFQRMAFEVNSREERLQQQVQMLQIAIDEVQKKRTVAQIVETDHFQQLQKRAEGAEGQGETSNRFSPVLPYSRVPKELPICSQRELSEPKIISVHSYRGGTGKSNLTSNLAISIASQGKRVGIVDTDIQSPGIHMLFGLDEESIDRTLNDYLWERCAIWEAAYDVSHVLHKQPHGSASDGNIYLVPASIKVNNITRMLREGYEEEKLIDGFRELIRELQLDYLFIDTHPGVNEETLRAITVSSLLVMILRPDYQDYQGTAITVELARILAVSQMLLVVNKALPTFDPEAFQHQLEAAYNVSVAGILPLCEEMVHLASSDIFCLRYPNHPWSEVLHAIAKQITSAVWRK